MAQPELDFGAGESGGNDLQPEGTFTVSQLADLINRRLRSGFDDGFWVRGEIQGWNARGPHAYFTLADDLSDTKAVVSVAFFAPQRERLRKLLDKHRLSLGDGIKVRIHGYLDYYAPNGRLSLKMSGIDPRFTLGDLAQQRDQVMRRLVANGLFDANRRRVLSPIPLRVGVVTSVGSAAWHDFEHELARSGIGFELSVCDVRVQGERAGSMVAGAISTLALHTLDAIVVIRGGGARNELAVFDAETIAVAIARSPVPVLTGLGHEVDRSVADEVAHTSHKTPTACANALVSAAATYLGSAERAFAGVVGAARERIDAAERRLADRAHRIARRTHGAVGRAEERLTTRAGALRTGSVRQLATAGHRVEQLATGLQSKPSQLLAAELRRVDGLAREVRAVDPVVMLARGWTITRTADGALVRTPDSVQDGDVISTQLAAGHVTSRVTDRTTLTEQT